MMRGVTTTSGAPTDVAAQRGRRGTAQLASSASPRSRPAGARVATRNRHQQQHLTTCRLFRPTQPGAEQKFAASVTVDEELLHIAPTQLIMPEECQRIYGYPRDQQMDEKYDMGKVIGAGSFGVVREATVKATGEKVAVKTISKLLKKIPKHLQRQGERGTMSKHLTKLQLEVDAMKSLRGSLNAVRLNDLYEGNEEVRFKPCTPTLHPSDPFASDTNLLHLLLLRTQIHLIMELCTGGTIYERITANDFTESSAARVARSILQMISQCHSKGVVYMDVKPENFLYLTNDANSVLKGTDFGLALKYTQGKRLSTRRGTPVVSPSSSSSSSILSLSLSLSLHRFQ